MHNSSKQASSCCHICDPAVAGAGQGWCGKGCEGQAHKKGAHEVLPLCFVAFHACRRESSKSWSPAAGASCTPCSPHPPTPASSWSKSWVGRAGATQREDAESRCGFGLFNKRFASCTWSENKTGHPCVQARLQSGSANHSPGPLHPTPTPNLGTSHKLKHFSHT